jgi:hypothetical protein
MFALSLGALGALAAVADLLPVSAGLACTAAAAVVYPLIAVVGGSRAAQTAFEVHEAGVWGTERRRLLRFRRFAYWTDLTVGRAREVAPGKYHLEVALLGGTVLSSIPGELNREAVEYVNEHAGFQLQVDAARA